MGENTTNTKIVVSYVPTVLRSMSEICNALGVGPKTVKAWVEKGAPIAVEGEGAKMRYSAELARLQVWREGQVSPAMLQATAGVDAADAQ